jgi:hypothetical protein
MCAMLVNPKIMFRHLAYMCARLVMLGNTCNIAHMPHTHMSLDVSLVLMIMFHCTLM